MKTRYVELKIMVLYLKLSVESSDKRFVEALYSTLQPDNVSIPEGLEIRSHVSGDKYVFEVEASSYERFDTLKNTADELLSIVAFLVKLKNLKQ